MQRPHLSAAWAVADGPIRYDDLSQRNEDRDGAERSG